MQDKLHDVIVVGGGMAAAHAAWPLVEAGKNVLMIDGGVESTAPAFDSSGKDFESIRANDDEQSQLFLGEGLGTLVAALGKSHSSLMTSGNRAYVSEHTDTHLPLDLQEVQIVQSLAKGGLSEAWGAVCGMFTDRELEHAGIPASDMHAHYQTVIDRVGISGHEDGYRTQQPARITQSMQNMMERFQKLPSSKRGGFDIRPALLALLTERLGKREPTTYQDLDFYRTNETAIYRARYTIGELEQRKNFTYLPGHVVSRVQGTEDEYEVVAIDFKGTESVFRARRVILAAGTVNSNRMLLQSDPKLASAELMIKPDYTIACIDPRLIGTSGERTQYSLCQLTLDLPGAAGESELYANVYNYRALMLWRLLQYAPLPVPEAFAILSRFASALMLVDVRFPGSEGLCEMKLGEHGLSIKQKQRGVAHKNGLPKVKKFLRTLGIIPIHTAELPLGASVHYAGGIRTDARGEVEDHSGLYAADASSWRALPAKPTGLTIMANANRIGTEVLKSFEAR